MIATGEKHFKAGVGWIVEMPDDHWHGVKTPAREAIVQRCVQRAIVEGCTSISIFTIADPIFPLYGHTGKIRVHTEQIRGSALPIKVLPMYRVEIEQPEWDGLPERQRVLMIAKARDAANKCGDKISGKYEIVVVTPQARLIVETGRV